MRQVGNKWNNDDGWEFHNLAKNCIRGFLDGSCTEESFKELEVQDWWYEGLSEEDRKNGCTEPANVELLKEIIKAYIQAVEEKKIKVPLKYFMYKKLLYFALSIYVQDSAYYERFGGIITFLVNEIPKHPDTYEGNKKILENTYKWYLQVETRNYGKQWMIGAFQKIIGRYSKERFYQQSVDVFLEQMRLHRTEFLYSERFNPDKWFPKGRGQISWLLEGRVN